MRVLLVEAGLWMSEIKRGAAVGAEYDNSSASTGGAVGDTILKKEIGGFSVYEMYADEIEKYSEEQKCFVPSKDEVYVDFIIREEEKELYCFYFMNSMADSKNIEEYLSKVGWYEIDSDTEGRYRWLMQLY